MCGLLAAGIGKTKRGIERQVKWLKVGVLLFNWQMRRESEERQLKHASVVASENEVVDGPSRLDEKLQSREQQQ